MVMHIYPWLNIVNHFDAVLLQWQSVSCHRLRQQDSSTNTTTSVAVGANNHHHVAADSCMQETEFVPVVREVTARTSEGSEIVQTLESN